ncbi:hypothetical protein JVT61DRAFT_493 [Boletus reticuloceps]|uniref:DUF6534 domain-containing protein n=1 Tax=Boletus reticuloceps TaxID=495285 RepID=A0A8I3ADZ2_9AGAM|nr:hypothetical protein JVT61DRAFT_493 [Boletus reticuloceps]
MPTVQLLFGPMLIGVFFNTMLYGTMVVQTYIYFQTFKKDAWWIKMFVFYLLFCETLNTGFDIGMMYEPLVVRYGTPRAVEIAPIMLSADPLMTVMISSAVQLFIAWRVRIMNKSSILPAIISFFAITSFAGGVATTVSVTIINEYAYFHQFDGAVITWLASSAAADVIITTSLVYSLLRQRTGYAATDDLINKIIRMTVQTGMITAVSATLDVTLFLVIRNATLNYIWDFALSKLYSNSILSTLNARGGWRATSSARENVLFGTTVSMGDCVIDNHRQTESHTIEFQTMRPANVSAMKLAPLSPGASDPEGCNVSVTNETYRMEP